MCGFKEIKNIVDFKLLTDQEIDELIQKIYLGLVTTRSLDANLYLKTVKLLFEGVNTGYQMSKSVSLYELADEIMLRALKTNVAVFSGAKTYQQVRTMQKLLYSGGKPTMWAEFKKKALETYKDYNVNYLNAEYNSAMLQSRSASQWVDIERTKQLYPLLRYQTVGDGRVRPTHAALDNIVRPVDDPFWDKYMPQNGWNCRCTVEQEDEAEVTDLRGFKQPNDVPDLFLFNAGKKKIVFSNEHPYYQVATRDKGWAKKNFGLPL